MKRCLLLLLCLLLAAPAASAKTFVVNYNVDDDDTQPGRYQYHAMLIDDTGEAITGREDYARLWPLTPEGTPEEDMRYGAIQPAYEDWAQYAEEIGSGESYQIEDTGMVDADGWTVMDFYYTDMEYVEGTELIKYRRIDGTVGLVDINGDRVAEVEGFSDIWPSGQGTYLLLLETRLNRQFVSGNYSVVYYMDDRGAVRDTGRVADDIALEGFSEGVYCVSIWFSGYHRYIYMDTEGEELFDRDFEFATPFKNGLAAACEARSDRYGILGIDGDYVVEPVYDEIFQDTEDKYDAAYIGREYLCFASDHLDVRSAEDASLLAQIPFRDGERPSLYSVGRGMFALYYDGDDVSTAVEIYDVHGSLLMTCAKQWDYGYESRAIAETPDVLLREDEADGWQMLTLDGELLTSGWERLYVKRWEGGEGRVIGEVMCPTKPGDRWSPATQVGLLNERGEELLAPVYDSLEVLSMDRCWAKQGAKQGMIDLDGGWLYTLSDYEYLVD